MKLNTYFLLACMLILSVSPFMANAEDGNWKKGRIYYRMVCTVCHEQQAGGAIAPSFKTKADWAAYLEADSHAKDTDKVSYYVSKQYKESIKDSNKAAKKFLNTDDEKIMADIKAFVIHGAKDSDNPAGCK